jgi:hypothetical protein
MYDKYLLCTEGTWALKSEANRHPSACCSSGLSNGDIIVETSSLRHLKKRVLSFRHITVETSQKALAMPGSTPLNAMMAEMSDHFVSKADFDALSGAADIDKRNLDIAWIILCSEPFIVCCCCCFYCHSEISLWFRKFMVVHHNETPESTTMKFRKNFDFCQLLGSSG